MVFLIFLVVSFLFFGFIFYFEDNHVQKMDDNSKFKKWWRNNIIAHYTGNEDL